MWYSFSEEMESFMKDFFDKLKQTLHHRESLKTTAFNWLYWLVTLVYFELLVHIAAYGMPGLRFGYVLSFSAVFAAALCLITVLVPGKIRFSVTTVLHTVLILLYGSQLVYYFVFGTLYSVAQVQQGGAAVTSFWRETLVTMLKNILWMAVLFVPLAGSILLKKRSKTLYGSTKAVWCVILALIAVVLQFTTIQVLEIGGTGYFSDHYFYYNDSITTDQATRNFGLLTALRLDLTAGDDSVVTEKEPEYYVPTKPPVDPTEETQAGQNQTQEQQPVEYNVLEIDFDKLAGMTTDKTIQALNNYCSQLTGTNKNEYTGMLSDYNLIVLCAEAFATGVIDEDLTPTLYRLVNEGIVFENYYNSFPNNTSDGEYSLCMGLYPDTSRYKLSSSFYASRDSYLPFTLGNIFQNQKGVKSYGYHNYTGTFYGREETHPNIGYEMKFNGDGMTFTNAWPASDLEMMQQSVDDYLKTDEQFHAYYMTFSGHLLYDTYNNEMVAKNWDLVKDLPYSYAVRSYLSCNIELDRALEYLMQRLEEAGVADKTAIVLAGDHFPYGLTADEYEELLDYGINKFNQYKSSLIFWVGGLEEPIVVKEYCCNVDVLPTILNLWGFDYDSRLLAGTDVFSDGEHMAVLIDKSVYTNKVWIDGSTGQVRYLVAKDALPEGYVENLIRQVETKFYLSTNILNSAYYNFVFEKGEVDVNWNEWEDPDGLTN